MQSHKSYWEQRISWLKSTIDELYSYKTNTMKDDELFEAIKKLKEVLADIMGICHECFIEDDKEIKLQELDDDMVCPKCNADLFQVIN